MPRTNHTISREEVERAIYLDFEGEGARSFHAIAPDPILAGILVDDAYEWTLLDDELGDVARFHEVPVIELPVYLEHLIDRARSEGRRIVYWTSHEAEVFEQHGFPPGRLGFDLKIPVKPHFRDAFAESKKAYKKIFGASTSMKKKLGPKAFGLCVQCARLACDLAVPTDYGFGKVGDRIRYCKRQAKSKDSYASWSPGAKRKWTSLVKHNRKDCEAMLLLAKKYAAPE